MEEPLDAPAERGPDALGAATGDEPPRAAEDALDPPAAADERTDTAAVADPDPAAADPDPAAARRGPRPRVTIDPDTRRSRVLVLLRLPLAVPHLLWWWAWSLLVALALPLVWLVALVLGRLPRPLHRVLRAYARYSTHLTAFLSLASNPFPGFLGTLPYPLDLHVPDAVRQPRLSILVRWLAVVPALVVLWVLDWLRWIVVPVAWLIALVVGRLPKGLVEVLTYVARFQALTLAYALLLTRRYPTFGGDQT